MNKSKLWGIGIVVFSLALLTLLGGATAVIDPFFHYHAPLRHLAYPIDNQRYQNDGIVRHFDYDALITGTSMTENFRTSELDTLFAVTSVKVSYSGGSFQEITDNLQQAIDFNPDLKLVIFAMDEWFLFADRTLLAADGDYPTYLYDDNLLNDTAYLWNKEILLRNTAGVLDRTRNGGVTTTFDDYSRWDHLYRFEAENVIENYARPEITPELTPISEEERAVVTENISGTVLRMARENPHIQFYYFFPPYSLLNWDSHVREGKLDRLIQGFIVASELMLDAENIHLFSFFTNYDWTTDLNNYHDIVHYSSEINSQILQKMKNGENKLTKDNYLEHWQEVSQFYSAFDYDALF